MIFCGGLYDDRRVTDGVFSERRQIFFVYALTARFSHSAWLGKSYPL